MEKEIKITPPEGYEIDRENSTFECIKFKPLKKRWRGAYDSLVSGYVIESQSSNIRHWTNLSEGGENINVFATEKQAKSALAMAQISQIMANDERFGGVVTDEEWKDTTLKFVINRVRKTINKAAFGNSYEFLSFHTQEQRDLFLEENEDLVKDYLMID